MMISDVGLGIEFIGFFLIFFNTKGLLLTIMMWRKQEMWIKQKNSGHGYWQSFMANFYVTNYNSAFSPQHWTNKWKTYYGFTGFGLILFGLILQSSYFRDISVL